MSRNIFHHEQRRGFTFVEVVLYLAILSFIIGSLVPFAWNVIGLGEKHGTIRETQDAARYISERLKYEIRNANGIDAASDFDINFAQDETKKLSLKQSGSSDERSFFVLNGDLYTHLGNGEDVMLHSDYVKITNLTFTKYASSDDRAQSVGFTLTVEADYPNTGNRQEYKSSITIESSAEIMDRTISF